MFLERNMHIHILAMINMFLASWGKNSTSAIGSITFLERPLSLLNVESEGRCAEKEDWGDKLHTLSTCHDERDMARRTHLLMKTCLCYVGGIDGLWKKLERNRTVSVPACHLPNIPRKLLYLGGSPYPPHDIIDSCDQRIWHLLTYAPYIWWMYKPIPPGVYYSTLYMHW